jgi:Homeodomain
MTPGDFPHEHYQYHIAPQQQQHQQQHQQQQHQHHHDTQPSLSYHHYPGQPQHVEAYYPAPHHAEYTDYGSITPDQEDFEGCSEILTRPRLTKEQVEVLESQFQAHPKPNGNVKRQLALQTKLTLPRVAVSISSTPFAELLINALIELVPKPTGKGQADEKARRV